MLANKRMASTNKIRYLLTKSNLSKPNMTTAMQNISAMTVVVIPLKCIMPAVITMNTAKYTAVKAWDIILFCLRGAKNTNAVIISNKKIPTRDAVRSGGRPVSPKNETSSAPVAKPAPITVLIISNTSAAIFTSQKS